MAGLDASDAAIQKRPLEVHTSGPGRRIIPKVEDQQAEGSQAKPNEHDELRERAVADRELISSMAAEGVADRELIAALAAEGIADRKQIEEFKVALNAARRIGAALGILMATRHLTEDAAFTVLREASQRSNRKLRDLADELCTSGDTSSFPEG